jgi:hypothetical protein
MARYAIVTTEPQAGFDNAGNPVTLPAGTVVNVAEWDGVTPWNPGEGLDAVADADAVAMIGGSYGGGVFGPIP